MTHLKNYVEGVNRLINSDDMQAIPASALTALDEANVAIQDAGALMRKANESVGRPCREQVSFRVGVHIDLELADSERLELLGERAM